MYRERNKKKESQSKKTNRKSEWVKREIAGALVQWSWFNDAELGFYPKNWIRRFPHLIDRGRWVITRIKKKD